MRRKIVTVEVIYDTEETWEKALKDMEEVFDLMKNIRQSAKIVAVEQGVNTNAGPA
jgi:hypothetical protein